jgi:hypothetical protein
MCSITMTPRDPIERLAALSLERLEREIAELAAHINAATCRWLMLVGELDRRGGWAEWGCRSCTHWLSYRCGLSPAAAREQVRVARLLARLPEIRATFERGELCYSQVRALTRVATPDTEPDLIEIARHATAAQLETVVRAFRGVLGAELGSSRPEYERRYVRCQHDDDGSLLIHARLPAEEGALVLAGLEAARDALREARAVPAGGADGSASAEATQIGDIGAEAAEAAEPADGEESPGERTAVSNADALALMAETLLASGPAQRTGGERHQVVVHVDAAMLDNDEEGSCQLEDGAALHPETARRLACDASVVRILERDGRPLSVGRRTRSVPPALRRALRSRDRICRFPGCSQPRFLHAHHVEHWAQGGRTDLSNLVHLCPHHHRLVHEGGYRMEHRAGGALRFRRPDGRPLPTAPARARGERRELLRRHGERGLVMTEETCAPRCGDRLDLGWVVGGLAEADPRLHS